MCVFVLCVFRVYFACDLCALCVCVCVPLVFLRVRALFTHLFEVSRIGAFTQDFIDSIEDCASTTLTIPGSWEHKGQKWTLSGADLCLTCASTMCVCDCTSA